MFRYFQKFTVAKCWDLTELVLGKYPGLSTCMEYIPCASQKYPSAAARSAGASGQQQQATAASKAQGLSRTGEKKTSARQRAAQILHGVLKSYQLPEEQWWTNAPSTASWASCSRLPVNSSSAGRPTSYILHLSSPTSHPCGNCSPRSTHWAVWSSR